MSDTSLNTIIQYGTNAERIAFTPDPAMGSQVLYIWYETDNAPDTYAWDGSAWVQINPTGAGGDVVGPASAVADRIAVYNGTTGKLIKDGGATIADILAAIPTTAITELTGDVTAGPGPGSEVATIPALQLTFLTDADETSDLPNSRALLAGTNISFDDTTPGERTVNASGGGGGGGLVLLAQHTASASASLDFTSIISSTYDDYLIEFINVAPVTDGANLRMKISFDNGANWQAGANYRVMASVFNQTGFQTYSNSSVGTSSFYIGGTLENTAPTGVCGSLKMYNPLGTGSSKLWVGETVFFANDTNHYCATIGLVYLDTTAIDAIQFLMDSGNIASGTIRLYGVEK